MIRTTAVTLLFATAVTACSAPRKPAPPEPTSLQLDTPSGPGFAATLYATPTLPAPTCILMTMPGGTREDWDPFVKAALRQGIASVVIDTTPLDQAGKPIKKDVRAYTDADWNAVVEGVFAAKVAAIDHGADPDNLAVGGAGITANLALRAAHNDFNFQATILLSPGLVYSGIATEDTMRAFGNRPVFMAVSEGDAYANSSSRQLKDIAQGFSELRVYDGAAHGTDLFGTSDIVVEQILQWLKPLLFHASA